MIALLCVLALSALGIFALLTWKAVRMAQLTDTSVRAEWADYKAEVNGALDELVMQVGDIRQGLGNHNERLSKLEADDRHTGLKRVAGVVR